MDVDILLGINAVLAIAILLVQIFYEHNTQHTVTKESERVPTEVPSTEISRPGVIGGDVPSPQSPIQTIKPKTIERLNYERMPPKRKETEDAMNEVLDDLFKD